MANFGDFLRISTKRRNKESESKVNKKAATLSNIHRDQYVDAVSFWTRTQGSGVDFKPYDFQEVMNQMLLHTKCPQPIQVEPQSLVHPHEIKAKGLTYPET